MEKYEWDINHILSRGKYYKELVEKSDGEAKVQYQILCGIYSRLMLDYLFTIGIDVNEKVPDDQKLINIKSLPKIAEYDDFSLEIQKSIFSKINSFVSDFPYVRYSESIDLTSAIKYIRDAIHDIFGEVAYNEFSSITKSSKNIHIGNENTSTYVIHVPDPDYEENYILLKNCRNIELVSQLAHEAGHNHRILTNSVNIPKNHLLLEYESFSYQLRILDYFINNGIYKCEAIKAMIRIINMIDAHVFLMQHEELLNSFTIKELTKKAHDLNLYNRIHVPNNEILLDELYTLKQKFIAPYIYSAMCVFDDIYYKDDNSRYNYIINNIGKIEEEKLLNEVISDPEHINDLVGYQKYRQKVRKLYDECVKK